MHNPTNIHRRAVGARITILATTVAIGLAVQPWTSAVDAAAKKPTTTAAGARAAAVSGIPPIVGGHPVTATVVYDPATVTSPGEQCFQSGGDAKGICARIGFVTSPMSGDISGPVTDASSLWFLPSSPTVQGFVGTLVLANGTIAGCGTGTFVLAFGPSPVGTASPSGGGDIPGFWRITFRSKSSPLANVEGQGVIWADSFGPGPITAHLNGSVRC